MKSFSLLLTVSLCVVVLSAPRALWASGSSVGFDVEPIIGYERVQKIVPDSHVHDRLVYGGRITFGLLLLSAEAEYLHGWDTETFTTQNLTTTDTTDSVKLGLRSSVSLLKTVEFYGRAGGQATQNKHEEVQSGVASSVMQPITYNPYAGAGLRVHLLGHLSLNGDFTVVFVNFPNNLRDNNYQATGSLVFRFP